MTEVDFYVIDAPDPGRRKHFACRLANKAFSQGHQVFLVNGLDRRYAVEVGAVGGPGETHHLPPGVAVAVTPCSLRCLRHPGRPG